MQERYGEMSKRILARNRSSRSEEREKSARVIISVEQIDDEIRERQKTCARLSIDIEKEIAHENTYPKDSSDSLKVTCSPLSLIFISWLGSELYGKVCLNASIQRQTSIDQRDLPCWELSLSRRIPPTPWVAWLASFDAYRFASSWALPMFFLYRIRLFPNQLLTCEEKTFNRRKPLEVLCLLVKHWCCTFSLILLSLLRLDTDSTGANRNIRSELQWQFCWNCDACV